MRTPITYIFQKVIILLSVLILFDCNNLNEQKVYKIGFSQCISKDDWRKAMDFEMNVEASLYPEIDLTIFQANGDLEAQKAHIEFMIEHEFDVIIISPAEPEPFVPLVEKAYDQDIPVIVIDRKINSEKITAFVGADNLEVGQNAGNYIVSTNKNNINVIEIKGHGQASPEVERHLGFHQIVDNEPNINVLYSFSVDDIDRTNQIFDSLDISPIHYVYAFNDIIAYDAWKIAKSKGVEKDIKFIGVDGLYGPDNGIELVQKGVLTASILYPTGGDEAIKIAMKVLKNEKISKNNVLSTTVIDKRNADIMQSQYNRIHDHQIDIENQQQKIVQQQETYSTQSNILKIVLVLLITSIALGAYSIYSRNSIRRKKRELELRNKKITIQRNQIKKFAKDLEISNEAKINFFTGLSHEFKTPITLILSSVESLSENNVLRKYKLLDEIDLIFNNSKRLLRLINQLLDFRKVEDRKFILKASKTNLYQFSQRIFRDFNREAEKRNIKYTIATNNEDLDIYLDRNLMDKVYFNLLSNAFKFTPNNGSISLDIEDDQGTNYVKIHFKDSGIGILKSELNKVFEPFFQGSNNTKISSGIGLYLSKEFVDLHKGSIEVNSKHGTEFTITLYKGDAHLESDEIVYEPDIIYELDLDLELDYQDETFHISKPNNDQEKYSILIIEDNLELITFLNSKLNVEYDVHTSDGTDAIEKALELIPDLIISDYNLPDKNGFEICRILKSDLRTSHIPIIILTAFDSKEFYLEGLQAGSDLYLTKPFSLGILNQSLKTLLYNREKLRYYYINNIYKIGHENKFGSSQQDFLFKLNEIVENNINDSNFSVENLADKLHVSRVQLYRKIKAILGINISDHIQNIRLEKAKNMIEETQLTISEIAYAVGYSTPNYFSTAFKNKYGNSPMSYRNP